LSLGEPLPLKKSAKFLARIFGRLAMYLLGTRRSRFGRSQPSGNQPLSPTVEGASDVNFSQMQDAEAVTARRFDQR
jgi:hypothetical protein